MIQKLQDSDGIIVRSATKARKELIEACPRLKIIVRAGVGLDNVDVDFAKSKNISVFNTPGASTRAVAELTLAHIFALSRNLHTANRSLAGKNPDFAALKKSLAGGMELKDKTVGIIGFGRIRQELAKLCLPMGMKVIAYDPSVDKGVIHYDVFGDTAIKLTVEITTTDFNKVIQKADFICVHISGKDVIIGKEQMLQMKKGACLINTSRGGVISESDLIEMLDNGHLVSLLVNGNYKAWRRRRLEDARPQRGENSDNRFIVPRAQFEQECREAGFEIVGHVDFLPRLFMWRAYVLRKKTI